MPRTQLEGVTGAKEIVHEVPEGLGGHHPRERDHVQEVHGVPHGNLHHGQPADTSHDKNTCSNQGPVDSLGEEGHATLIELKSKCRAQGIGKQQSAAIMIFLSSSQKESLKYLLPIKGTGCEISKSVGTPT